MSRITLWLCCAAGLVLIVLGGIAGRTILPRTVIKYVQSPVQVKDLTEQQRDSLDAAWRAKFFIVSHGTRRVSHDTTFVSDTSEVQGLYRLIEAFGGQRPEQTILTQPIPVSASVRRFGMGVGAGAIWHDGRIMPLGAVSFEYSKNEILPVVGYDKSLAFGAIYRRRF